MSNLNLLPNPIKKQTIARIRYIQMADGAILLFLTVVLTAIALFGAQVILNNKKHKLEIINNNNLESQKIIQVNDLISNVAVIQKKYVKWSKLLKQFFILVPSGITIQHVNFNSDQKEISIDGHAETRDKFLKFKKALEESNLIKKVNSPISNLLHQVDFNFTLTAKLNK